MSLSDKSNARIVHPCKHWFEWSSENRTITSYDKEAKETNKLELPFKFIVLDSLNTVVGYSKKFEEYFWANEIRNNNDDLVLRTKKQGIIQIGQWKPDLKEIEGTSFAKSIYIAFWDAENNLQLGNLKLSGSALSGLSEGAIKKNLSEHKANPKVKLFPDEMLKNVGWFNFTRQFQEVDGKICEVVTSLWDKNGSIEFYRPVFKECEVLEGETLEQAMELDKTLQEYLKVYLKKDHSELSTNEAEIDDSDEFNQSEDDLEYDDWSNWSNEKPSNAPRPASNTSQVVMAKESQITTLAQMCKDKNLSEIDICLEFSDDSTEIFEQLTFDQISKAIASVKER